MFFIIIAIIALGVGYLLFRLVPRVSWHAQLMTESSPAAAQHQREQRYIEGLLLKFAHEKGAFTREEFLAYVPGLADCTRCSSHLEMAMYNLIAFDRLFRREGTYQLTERARALLERIEQQPSIGAGMILPMSRIYYHHNAVHAGRNQLLQ